MCVCVIQDGFDVFNALDLMENKSFLEKLKFGIGDGNLQYYLYNWRCKTMEPHQVGCPPLPLPKEPSPHPIPPVSGLFISDGNLPLYLYNWRCKTMELQQVGCPPLPLPKEPSPHPHPPSVCNIFLLPWSRNLHRK